MTSRPQSTSNLTLARIEEIATRLEDVEHRQQADSNMLIRIDERTNTLIADIKALKGGFVRKEEFDPYKKLMIAVIAGLIANSIALLYK